MGLFKAIKRAVRKVENFAHVATGRPKIGQGGDVGEDEAGLRSAAAKRLVTKQTQAGGGQIKYNTEETVE